MKLRKLFKWVAAKDNENELIECHEVFEDLLEDPVPELLERIGSSPDLAYEVPLGQLWISYQNGALFNSLNAITVWASYHLDRFPGLEAEMLALASLPFETVREPFSDIVAAINELGAAADLPTLKLKPDRFVRLVLEGINFGLIKPLVGAGVIHQVRMQGGSSLFARSESLEKLFELYELKVPYLDGEQGANLELEAVNYAGRVSYELPRFQRHFSDILWRHGGAGGLRWDNFGSNYLDSKSISIRWRGKDVYCWLDYESDQTLLVELTLISFNAKIAQWLRIPCFDGVLEQNAQDLPQLSLEVDRVAIGKTFNFRVIPKANRKGNPARFRIVNSWYSENPNASFDLGQLEHYATGNSGMLLEPTANAGEFIVRVNAGIHSVRETPRFEDIVFKLKIDPFEQNNLHQ